MKSIFIAFDQGYYDQIINILNLNHVRGFTRWAEVQGKGSVTGEPHFGNHAWPSINSSILTVVDDDKVKPILNDLKVLDSTSKLMGLRAFVWAVEDGI